MCTSVRVHWTAKPVWFIGGGCWTRLDFFPLVISPKERFRTQLLASVLESQKGWKVFLDLRTFRTTTCTQSVVHLFINSFIDLKVSRLLIYLQVYFSLHFFLYFAYFFLCFLLSLLISILCHCIPEGKNTLVKFTQWCLSETLNCWEIQWWRYDDVQVLLLSVIAGGSTGRKNSHTIPRLFVTVSTPRHRYVRHRVRQFKTKKKVTIC